MEALLHSLTTTEKIAQLDASMQPTGAVDRLNISAFAGWNGKQSVAPQRLLRLLDVDCRRRLWGSHAAGGDWQAHMSGHL